MTGAQRPVVVLRLRGRTSLGATFFLVIAGYAARLNQAGGRLYLSGVDAELADRMARTGRIDVDGPVQVFPAAGTLGTSTAAADEAAHTWLLTHRGPGTEPTGTSAG